MGGVVLGFGLLGFEPTSAKLIDQILAQEVMKGHPLLGIVNSVANGDYAVAGKLR